MVAHHRDKEQGGINGMTPGMTAPQLNALAAWFDDFVATFAGASAAKQRNYDLKVEHTYEVCANIERLTAVLKMEPEERRLASAIALCHDVGRFPQYQHYGTFNDATSLNHATLAIQTLNAVGILNPLADDVRSLLLSAVALHNVFTVPEDLDPILSLFVLLIRDADKLDIWRVLVEYYASGPETRASAVVLELPDTGFCTESALKEVAAGRMPNRDLLVTVDDIKLLQLSWVYDLNFDESFAIMAERGYLEDLADLLPCQEGRQEAVDAVRAYVQSRWKGQG
jgi:hypothetical protein